jgi:hypothetical protein
MNRLYATNFRVGITDSYAANFGLGRQQLPDACLEVFEGFFQTVTQLDLWFPA